MMVWNGRLPGAVVLVAVGKGLDAVSELAQALHGGRVEAVLGVHEARVPAPARRVAGGLRLLAVVEHAHQRLHVPLRLHVAAHHAEAHHRLARRPCGFATGRHGPLGG